MLLRPIRTGSGDDDVRLDDGLVVDLGAGDDRLLATAPLLLLFAGSGDDCVRLKEGGLLVDLGAGDDQLRAKGLVVAVDAGSGDDRVRLNDGGLDVDLGSGDDRLTADGFVRTLRAGSGDDRVVLHRGGRLADLGSGDDELVTHGDVRVVRARGGDDDVDLNGSSRVVHLGRGDDTVTVHDGGEVETVRAGGGDDLVVIHSRAHQVFGGGGIDEVVLATTGLQDVDLVLDDGALVLADRFTGVTTEITDVEVVTFADGERIAPGDRSDDDRSSGIKAAAPLAEIGAIQVGDGTQFLTVNEPTPTISVVWDRAVQQAVIESTGANGPTIASRAYAMLHTAIYDAWATFEARSQRVSIDVDGNNGALEALALPAGEATQAAAMSFAAFTVLSALYPEQVPLFTSIMQERYGLDPADAASPAAQIGIDAAHDLLALRASDSANQAGGFADTTGYVPVNPNPLEIVDIAKWTPESVPLDPEDANPEQTFLTPHWGSVEGFALAELADGATDVDAITVPAPQAFFLDAFAGSTVDVQAGTITLAAPLHVDGNRFAAGETIPVVPELVGVVINPGFVEQAETVIGFSARLNDTGKLIAEFWEDASGTSFPPGTWMSFGHYVSATNDHGLADDAKMFMALGNAVFDAGVATWFNKVFYDYVRPVRAIRDLGELGLIGEEGVDAVTGELGFVIDAFAGFDVATDVGLGTQTILAENFVTYQRPFTDASPPFAEYTSGHSAFSAAGAAVLRNFTGSDAFGASVTFAPGSGQFDPTTPSADVTLAWTTFTDAADEAGLSRLFGGIHFPEGDINGRTLGAQVGNAAYDLARSFWEGTAAETDRPFAEDALIA